MNRAESTAPKASDGEEQRGGEMVPQRQELARRARLGLALLAARTALVQATIFVGQILLARFLDPRDFGVYAILQFAFSFFVFFGDAGIGGALIQKKEEPTDRELSSVFTFQTLLSLTVVGIVWISAGLVERLWPDLPASGPWLLRVLALGLFLTSLRTIPAILMERHLKFGYLASLDVVLTLSFNVSAVVLAWAGFGATSLVVAVLVQGVTGALFAYAVQPFRPRLFLDRALLRPILRFGIPFQLTNVVGFLNGAVTPIYAGSVLGARPLGFINWAQNTGYFPLKAVEIVGRMAFPVYSRLQSEPAALAESFGRAVQLCAACTTFFVALFFSLGESITRIVFTDKWLPGLPLLYLYAGAISIGFYTPLIGALLNATGRPGLLFRLACTWTALAWLVVPFTTPRWNMIGFAAGYIVHVVLGNILMLALTPRLVPGARLLRRFMSPVMAGLLTFAVGRFVLAPVATSFVPFILSFVGLAVLHVGALLAIDRRRTIDSLSLFPHEQPKS